jgi:hypothetical protein
MRAKSPWWSAWQWHAHVTDMASTRLRSHRAVHRASCRGPACDKGDPITQSGQPLLEPCDVPRWLRKHGCHALYLPPCATTRGAQIWFPPCSRVEAEEPQRRQAADAPVDVTCSRSSSLAASRAAGLQLSFRTREAPGGAPSRWEPLPGIDGVPATPMCCPDQSLRIRG